MPMESVERFAGDVSKFREELQSVAGDDDVYIVSNTEAESERLREIFGQQDFAARLQFVEGALRTGFRSPRDGYRIYALCIADTNAMGKHLDKEKPQEDPLNRAILDVLADLQLVDRLEQRPWRGHVLPRDELAQPVQIQVAWHQTGGQ